MKKLRNILDNLSQKTKSGPLSYIHPFIDAVNAGLFDPDHSVDKAPFIRDTLNTKRYVISVVIALMPAFAVAAYTYGVKVWILLFIAYAEGGIIETFFAKMKNEEINEGFLVTGLLTVLVFPVTIPYWVFMIAVAFGIIFGKEIFGGVGHNVLNPALTGRIFVFLSWPALVAPSKYIVPSGEHILKYISGLNDAVSSASPLASQHSVSTSDLLWGFKAGCLGEVSSVVLILGGLYLIAVKVVNFRIPLGMILGTALFAWILKVFGVNGALSPQVHILSGGFLLGTFFMATDPVTSPLTAPAKFVFGLMTGFLVVLFRQFTPLTEGVMFAVLFMNMFSPLLDEIFLLFRVAKEANYERF